MSYAAVLTVLTWLLVLIPLVAWISAVILSRLAVKRPYITSLTERAISAILKAVSSTGIAVLVLNSYLHFWTLERNWSVGIIVACLLLLEISPVIWLSLYVSNRFRGDDDVA